MYNTIIIAKVSVIVDIFLEIPLFLESYSEQTHSADKPCQQNVKSIYLRISFYLEISFRRYETITW